MSRQENLAGKTVDGYLLVLMYTANAFSRSYLGESASPTANKKKITLREFHSVRLNAQTDREDFRREAASVSADISIQSNNGSAWYDSGKVSLASGGWQRLSFVVPASAPTISTIGVDLYCTSASGTVTVYIDSVGWR